jgi:iron complex outermembrane recepter protein
MLKLKPITAGVLAAFGAAGLLASLPASAQQATPTTQPQKIERVEVTGTNIRRQDTETAAPVQIITKEEIERSGAVTLSEVLRNIPANNTGALNDLGTGGFSPGGTSVSLRGLGAASTLVLVNGRRLAQYGFAAFQQTFVNLDSIPLAAVERVEVLKDGASAIYGAEAIAGVVNIILRRDYQGVEARASYGINTRGDVAQPRVSISGGFGDLAADKYNVFAAYEHSDRDSMKLSDTPYWLKSRDFRQTIAGGRDRRSAYSYPGTIFLESLVTGGGTIVGQVPGTTCNAPYAVVNGVCRTDVYNQYTVVPERQQDSLYAKGTLDLSATTQAYAEVGVTRNKYKYTLDPQFYVSAFSFNGIPIDPALYGLPAAPANSQYVVLLRAGDIGNRITDIVATDSRLVLGLKGSLGKWDYDTGLGSLKSKGDVKSTGNILVDQMEDAIASGAYQPGRVNSAAVIAGISPTLKRTGESKTDFVDFKISTPELFALPAGTVGLATGVEYRKESYDDAPDPEFFKFSVANQSFGNVFGFVANPSFGERNVKAAFGEMTVPILKNLEMQLAVRHDRYSDKSGSSTTPKVGIKWNASPEVTVRGTYSEGFRAPTFRENSTATSRSFLNGIDDPLNCTNGVGPGCGLNVSNVSSGNPDLKPERSKSWTLGVVLEPSREFSAAIDLYDIKRRDDISTFDYTYLLDNQSRFPNQVIRDPVTGQITELRTPYLNLGFTRVQGADADFRVRQNLGENGKLTWGANVAYTHHYYVKSLPDSEVEDWNGLYDQPRVRATYGGTWEKGAWTVGVTANYTHHFYYRATQSDPPCTPNATAIFNASMCKIRAWTTLDLGMQYSGIKDLTLGLTIQNLLDEGPPLNARGIAGGFTPFNSTYHNPIGRYFTVSARYKFK